MRGGRRQEEEQETDADSEAWGSEHTGNVWRSVVANLKRPQLSLATRGEDWASQGQPKGKAEIPVVTRECRRPVEVAGPLGTPLGLAQRKRAWIAP